MAKQTILFLTFLFTCFITLAQIEKIDTDRPDQTESTFTVPKKWFQVETGFVREKISDLGAIWSLPTILSKYGLSEKWELRLLTEYFSYASSYSRRLTDTAGFLPLTIGFKVNLLEEKGIRPRISLIGHAGFNRLSSRMTASHYGSFFAPSLVFTFQNSTSENAAIGYNLGVEWEDTKEPPAWIYTLAYGSNIGERWYAYIEVFGAAIKHEPPQHTIDAGIAYWINNNMKVDLSGGFGLNSFTPRNYIAVGFSFRIKTGKK